MSQYSQLDVAIRNTVTCIPAGGAGKRLMPLTQHRAKPAVPFGAIYRVIDIPMSNCVNSGFNRIYVLPQYLNHSLNEHLSGGWDNMFNTNRNQFLRVVSPQCRRTNSWYTGSASSIYENLCSIGDGNPQYVMILASDQVYKMDYRELLQSHLESGAEMTMAALPVKQSEASHFGVIEIDADRRLKGFKEKPAKPVTIPGRPGESLVSMGIYIFNAKTLVEVLTADMLIENSKHDFGKNIIPQMVQKNKPISVFLFEDEAGHARYWSDIGTPDAFFEANMDLVSVDPKLNIYDEDWPWHTFRRPLAPAKTVFHTQIFRSVVSGGCVFDDCCLVESVISPRVRIGINTNVTNSIIMSGVTVGNNVLIDRAIIDKENVIPDGAVIAAGHMKYDGEHTITESGIVIIPRHYPAWTGE